MYVRKSYKMPTNYVIKHVRKKDPVHRSTSWKVAYADFVTAMMAFFLLLWLYASLGAEQKINIANYFTPTDGVLGASGSGETGGLDASMTEGTARSAMGADGLVLGQLQQGPVAVKPVTIPNADSDAEDVSIFGEKVKQMGEGMKPDEMFMAITQEVKTLLQRDDLANDNKSVLLVRTKDTLKIHLINDPDKPIFMPKNATLTTYGEKQLKGIARIIAVSGRSLQLDSHVATSGGTLDPQYTQWELSTERARTTRQVLSAQGVDIECISQIASHADNKPLVPSEPASPRNNRVTITLSAIGCSPTH